MVPIQFKPQRGEMIVEYGSNPIKPQRGDIIVEYAKIRVPEERKNPSPG